MTERVSALETAVAELTVRLEDVSRACAEERADITNVTSNQTRLVKLLSDLVPKPRRRAWLYRVLG